MLLMHGWFRLSETTEEDDVGGLQRAVDEIRERTSRMEWATIGADVFSVNGAYFLVLTARPPRKRWETERIDELLEFVRERLKGSWGLLYERDEEMPVPPGPNAFRVRVLARG